MKLYGVVDGFCAVGKYASWILTSVHVIPQKTYETVPAKRLLMEEKGTPWLLGRRRTISTERPPMVCEFHCQILWIGLSRSQRGGTHTADLSFLDRNRYSFFKVAPHLCPRGRMDPVSDPLLLIICGSAGNRNRDLWVCRHEL
jgi:hypothetical protein